MVCEACGGTGTRTYPNSNTYKPKKAGERYLAMLTEDTCNVCWGSGDSEKPNPSLLEKVSS